MAIHDALHDVISAFDETSHDGGTNVRGAMRFGPALEGPPNRLHGGHHAHVRTLPIVERLAAHDGAVFPCEMDVQIQKGLPLEQDVPFEARYEADDEGWVLRTRFDDSDRLAATLRSLPAGPLLTPDALGRWKALYEAARDSDNSFELFGVRLHLSPDLCFVRVTESRANAEGQIAKLVTTDGTLDRVFVATQLDAVGATSRGAFMRHPHFTKHITLRMATDRIPADADLLVLGDRSGIEEDTVNGSAPVEIKGRMWGTAHVDVVLVDSAFENVYATGRVTVHPVDPKKFAPLQKMRALRKDV